VVSCQLTGVGQERERKGLGSLLLATEN